MAADDVDLDLDAFQREGQTKPFAVKLGGRRYEFAAIADLDFRLGAEILTADTETSLRMLLPDEDREPFLKNDLPSFKAEKLFKDYLAHYAMPAPGEAPAS